MHFSAMGRTDDLDEVKGQPQSALDVERSITTRSMTHSSAPYSQAGARSACHRVCGDEKTLCEEGRVSVSNPPYTRNILTGRARTAVVSVWTAEPSQPAIAQLAPSVTASVAELVQANRKRGMVFWPPVTPPKFRQ